MKKSEYPSLLTTGLAMFSMFFGAGNVVFPLIIGYRAAGDSLYAIAGLLLTAVSVPFLGLISMILFQGHYHAFFNRVGTVGGYLFIVIIMAMIGPFVGIPRCIDLSYTTLKLYVPFVSLFMFSLCACFVIFLFTIRKSKIIDWLGNVLSPLLLISLVILVIKGLLNHPPAGSSSDSAGTLFMYGFKQGYNTLDLFAAFFFACVVLLNIKRKMRKVDSQADKRLAVFMVKASLIGGGLLGVVYASFAYLASFYAQVIGSVEADELIGVLSSYILGPSAGLVGNAVVALACLTTAITLAAVFADFVGKELLISKLDYRFSLVITLMIAFAMANLGFTRLMQLMAPIWHIFYPVFIVLSIVNILYKVYDFKPVKVPVVITLLISLIVSFW